MTPPEHRCDPVLQITTPSGLVTAIPYLVGFQPHESLVLIFMSPRPRFVVVTLRIDLPDPGDDGRDSTRELAAAVARALDSGVRIDLVHALVYSAQARSLPFRSLIHELASAMAELGIDLGQSLAAHGDRVWDYACPCALCLTEGHVIEADEALDARFHLVSSGVGYANTREDLEAAVRPAIDEVVCPVALQEMRVAARRGDSEARALWRRESEDDLVAALRGPVDEAVLRCNAARWALALSDSRVREPVLRRLLEGPAVPTGIRPDLHNSRSWLIALVRMLPGPDCAPVAATLSALAWQHGDGASARIAAERALEADPANKLATLMFTACGSGLPPSSWRDILMSFTLDELRSATGPAGGGPADCKLAG